MLGALSGPYPQPEHEMTTPDYATAPTTPAPSSSAMEDILEIFYRPSAVFARRRSDPRFWAAFIVASLLFALGMYVMVRSLPNIMDDQFAKMGEKIRQRNPQVTDDQIAQARSMQEKFAPIGFLIAGPLMIAVLSLVVWLVGKLFDGKIDMKQAFMVGSLASLPRFLDPLIAGILGMAGVGANATNMFVAMPSLGRVAPAGSTMLTLALLARISIGILWATALIAIGYRVVAMMPKGRAWLAAAVIWLLGTGYALWGARQLM